MSVSDLTRNCFQSGISAAKWASLCRLFLSKNINVIESQVETESAISNSVLVLYRLYPGDPALHDYLKYAIQNGLISLPVFVSTFLQAARSRELHNTATLDMLCRMALDEQYTTSRGNGSSLVAYGESALTVLGLVQDAMALLRLAHSLPLSHFHQLITSSSELLLVLLSCMPDISQISTTQAMVHFADVSDIMHNFQLSAELRHLMESFALTLSIIIGDDTKMAREAQMMQSMQLAFGKGDVVGSSSNTDVITLGLVLNHIMLSRANALGAGTIYPVFLFVATFRWSSWTPTVFYTQLLLAVVHCLSQSLPSSAMLWKAFAVGRLPHILVAFEKSVTAENATTETEWRHAMQAAVSSLLGRNDLFALCDNVLSAAEGYSESPATQPISRCLLMELWSNGLIDQRFALNVDNGISNDNTYNLKAEAQGSGLTLAAYIESKLTPDNVVEDLGAWLDRMWHDPASHSTFSDIVFQRFSSATSQLDIESLSHITKLLYSHHHSLDVLTLHVKIPDLISQALLFLELYDCETVGDPQSAVSHLGNVVLFLQLAVARYNLQDDNFVAGERKLSAKFLKTTSEILTLDTLTQDDAIAFKTWFKALFDSNSDGIEDTMLRSTPPQKLLRIAATLFAHAIRMKIESKIDQETLNNGIMYFTDPLLNWTLIGAVKALIHQVYQKRFDTSTHLDVLQTLLLSPSCPQPVLSLCGPQILVLLQNRDGKVGTLPESVNKEALQEVVTNAIGLREAGVFSCRVQHSLNAGTSVVGYEEAVRRIIQYAFQMARTAKAPSIDIELCLRILPPTKFLQLLWTELVASANVGEIHSSRRVAIFILTVPRDTTAPPLLPLFIHKVLPALIRNIDSIKGTTEHNLCIELLVTLVSSVLTAASHLELAWRSVAGKQSPVLGSHSSTMARRLAMDLRARRYSVASRTLIEKLGSSSLVANFPVFMEVGM
ncbi:hypothetical protein K435DRAFT_746183 [Dendrothele bispora CBS 962.96]|uniref:Mediator of RNA polymerase II transcription subunit 5 n=1 Tax=Dendrothele bispora (strain CBS 962.96) TaxID=1314807 RepID=A0A4S8MPS5_DENBC|nr:hypothetical protein K435DRAFT_746183 [Dendrothele bispora CBS 962.96]